jgi:hypothetical protein
VPPTPFDTQIRGTARENDRLLPSPVSDGGWVAVAKASETCQETMVHKQAPLRSLVVQRPLHRPACIPTRRRGQRSLPCRNGTLPGVFDPDAGTRYAPPPLDVIRRVFPTAQWLSPRLQCEAVDTFCVIWGVWFMVHGWRTNPDTMTMSALIHWFTRLLDSDWGRSARASGRPPPHGEELRADFLLYLQQYRVVPEGHAQRFADIIQRLTPDRPSQHKVGPVREPGTYITAQCRTRTEPHLEDSPGPGTLLAQLGEGAAAGYSTATTDGSIYPSHTSVEGKHRANRHSPGAQEGRASTAAID